MSAATAATAVIRRQLGCITRGEARIWVHGAAPTWQDAEHLMALWDEGNVKARLPGQREGDKHVRPFEEMMAGFRALGFTGANWDGHTPPDWLVSLAGVGEYDRAIKNLMRTDGTVIEAPLTSFATGISATGRES